MPEITLHERPDDWCHFCGQRFYPTADIRYPSNAEAGGPNTEYRRVCSNCAAQIIGVTNPDRDPHRAQTSFDVRLAEAERLILAAMTGFSRHLHATYADKLLRCQRQIRTVRSRYQ